MSRVMFKTAVLVLVLAACGKKSEQGEPKKEPTTSAAPAKLDVAALLAGTKGPALLGPYAKARFGMSKEELGAVVPGYTDFLDRKPSQRDADGAYYVWFDQTAADRGFEILTIYLPEAQIGEVEKAWGKPAHLEVYDDKYDVWLDRDARIRAHLGRSASNEPTLELMPYQPLAEILGPPGPKFGIETKRPFLGTAREDLLADYPKNVRLAAQQVGVDFLVDEYTHSNLFDVVLIAPDDGKTTGLVYAVTHGNDPKLKEERLAMLVAKYGAASETTSADGTKGMVLGKNTPEVVVFDKEGTWTVESPRRASN